MARSFNVAYRFLAKNSFSGVSKKVRASALATRVQFRRLRKTMRRTSQSFKQDSNSFVTSFKRMAGAAIAFFGIRGFITAGAEFQSALADLSAITGATGDDLANLRKETLLMAKASVTSQAQVAEAIKLVASAKPDLLKNLDALTATTKQVLLLKNAAGIELAEAANITAQGLNIFGAEASQAGRFVNVLAAGAKLGSSEIRETGEAMLIAGPAARAAGLSFEQLNSAIQITALGGIKASRSGTALNAIFGRLQRAGIDFKKLGLQGSFEVIKKEMDSLTSSTARAQFAAKIFGEEHSKVGFAILANVQHLDSMTKSITGTNIAQEQADIRLATFNSRWKKLGIVIKDLVIKTFLRIEPILSKAITSLTGFFNTIETGKIDAFGDSLGVLLAGFVQIGKIVGPVISTAIDVMINGFTVVMSILKGIGTLIGQIVGAIATFDFSGFSGSGIADAFSTGGKFLGIFGDGESPGSAVGAGGDVSRTDINMNINAPEGIIQSIAAQSTGSRNANVGINMAAG